MLQNGLNSEFFKTEKNTKRKVGKYPLKKAQNRLPDPAALVAF
jgi:hypothetical protein